MGIKGTLLYPLTIIILTVVITIILSIFLEHFQRSHLLSSLNVQPTFSQVWPRLFKRWIELSIVWTTVAWCLLYVPNQQGEKAFVVLRQPFQMHLQGCQSDKPLFWILHSFQPWNLLRLKIARRNTPSISSYCSVISNLWVN